MTEHSTHLGLNYDKFENSWHLVLSCYKWSNKRNLSSEPENYNLVQANQYQHLSSHFISLICFLICRNGLGLFSKSFQNYFINFLIRIYSYVTMFSPPTLPPTKKAKNQSINLRGLEKRCSNRSEQQLSFSIERKKTLKRYSDLYSLFKYLRRVRLS